MIIDVAAIILNWNNPCLTIKAVESLKWDRNLCVKVIIADNGSTDDSIRLLSKINDIELITFENNFGYAQGYNKAVKYAIERYNPEYLFLLNNDATAFPNTIDDLYANRGIADIISPKIYYPDAKTLWACGGDVNMCQALAKNRGQGEPDCGQYEISCEIAFASGCAIWIRSEVVRVIGLFNSAYQFYYEDVEFCHRAKLKNYKIVYLPIVKILHWANSTSGGEYEILQSRYRWRNRLIFAKHVLNNSQLLFFQLGFFPLIVLRDSIQYIIRRRFRGLVSAFGGLFAR